MKGREATLAAYIQEFFIERLKHRQATDVRAAAIQWTGPARSRGSTQRGTQWLARWSGCLELARMGYWVTCRPPGARASWHGSARTSCKPADKLRAESLARE